MKVKEVLRVLLQVAPMSLKEPWDNCGLLIGDEEGEVTGILVSLDLTDDVVREAENMGAELIVTHHPAVFSPMKSITPNSLEGRRAIRLLRSGISVISMHTNLDSAEGGVNDLLSKRLRLEEMEVLDPRAGESLKKVAVYVPEEFLPRVRAAMFEAGGGRMGAYEEVSFRMRGEGSFLPLQEAAPFIGTSGVRSAVPEEKLEMLVQERVLPAVLQAMRAAHPYEAPAFDVYTVEPAFISTGLGRIGTLRKPLSTLEFLHFVKDALGGGLRYTGEAKAVRRVAVGGGACAGLMDQAFRMGADAFVTADLKYHEFLDGKEKGYFLIDAGHFETEDLITDSLLRTLSLAFPEAQVERSALHKSPIEFFI